MKLRLLVAGAAVAALAVPAGSAIAAKAPKVTGGGQVLLSTDSTRYSTIAFTAQGSGDAVRGQVQFIDRTDGTRFHGSVYCLYVSGRYAEIGANRRATDGSGEGDRVLIRVHDNGEGANAESDMIQIDDTAPNSCGRSDDDDDPTLALARGNVQVHGAQSQQRSMSYGKALKLAGRR